MSATIAMVAKTKATIESPARLHILTVARSMTIASDIEENVVERLLVALLTPSSRAQEHAGLKEGEEEGFEVARVCWQGMRLRFGKSSRT